MPSTADKKPLAPEVANLFDAQLATLAAVSNLAAAVTVLKNGIPDGPRELIEEHVKGVNVQIQEAIQHLQLLLSSHG